MKKIYLVNKEDFNCFLYIISSQGKFIAIKLCFYHYIKNIMIYFVENRKEKFEPLISSNIGKFGVNREVNGAQGRTRTDTRLPVQDFESSASTSFTTWAKNLEWSFYYKID